MARQFPRFLFSDPQNTKSKGPFIVHTLFPQLIAKISFAENGFHHVDILEVFTPTDRMTTDRVVFDIHSWYQGVRMAEANLRLDFYDRINDITEIISAYEFFSNAMVSISMVYLPIIGGRLDISKDNWKVSIDFEDNDTLQSVILKLKTDYENKYHMKANWPF